MVPLAAPDVGGADVSTLGIVVGALAVPVGALLAGGFGIWRTNKTLGAEANRLDDQLEHDRRMRDVEELRRVLDDAVSALAAAIDGLGVALRAVQRGGDDGIPIEGSEELRDARRFILTVFTHYQRLRLRLGADSPVTESFWAAREPITAGLQVFDDAGEYLGPGDAAEILQHASNANADSNRFVDMCVEFAGTPAAVTSREVAS